jgi:hypothetical protein
MMGMELSGPVAGVIRSKAPMIDSEVPGGRGADPSGDRQLGGLGHPVVDHLDRDHFAWSDLACYAGGVGLGILVELAFQHRRYAPEW